MSELCGDHWHKDRLGGAIGILCDRKPRHTGKHMNREHRIEWWMGPRHDDNHDWIKEGVETDE